jgi:hypothetical protein
MKGESKEKTRVQWTLSWSPGTRTAVTRSGSEQRRRDAEGMADWQGHRAPKGGTVRLLRGGSHPQIDYSLTNEWVPQAVAIV